MNQNVVTIFEKVLIITYEGPHQFLSIKYNTIDKRFVMTFYTTTDICSKVVTYKHIYSVYFDEEDKEIHIRYGDKFEDNRTMKIKIDVESPMTAAQVMQQFDNILISLV